MNPLEFKGQSGTLSPPIGVARGVCGGLPIRYSEQAGLPVFESYWKATQDDIAHLALGWHVKLTMITDKHPPVRVEVERCAALAEVVPGGVEAKTTAQELSELRQALGLLTTLLTTLVPEMEMDAADPVWMAKRIVECVTLQQDNSARLRWLTMDLSGTQKEARNEVLRRMPTMSYMATCCAIDLAILEWRGDDKR